jgi:membrane protein
MKFKQNLLVLFKHCTVFARHVRTNAPAWWAGSRHFAAQMQARMVAERTTQTAGSLTFTTVLALVPLATVVLAVFTAFPAFDKLRLALENYFIESLMPKQVAGVVTAYLTLFAAKARNLSLMGAAFLVVTVVAMFLTIERSMNAIWQVPPRQHGRGRWFLGRVLSYWALLTVAPFVVGASFYATAQLIATTRGLGGGADELGKGVLFVLPVILSSGLWALVFRTLPNTQVRWVHALAGAVLSSILLAVLKELFVVYLAKYANFKELYGAFSVIPVLLIWLYLGWWVTLLGATFAAALPSWGTRHANPQGALQPLLAQLRVLRALSAQQASSQGAGALSLAQLQAQVFLPASAVQQALTPLQHLGWVAKLDADNPHAAHAWVLLCPLSSTTIKPLLNAALGMDAHNPAGTDDGVWHARWAALCACTVDQAMVLLEQKT